MLSFWEEMAEEVNTRLIKQDERMEKAYMKRRDLAKLDMRTALK